MRAINLRPSGTWRLALALLPFLLLLLAYVIGSNVRLAANPTPKAGSKLLGLIPTGKYASAVAVVGNSLFIANGKGTGVENSSNKVNDSGLYPNMPNKDYPADGYNKRGEYSAAVVSGNISMVDVPNEKELYGYTQATMRNNGLLGREKRGIFAGVKSPFKHVI